MSDKSELLKIVQAHLDQTGVSEAEFSRRIGAAPQTVNAWRKRGIRALPDARHLRGVADVTGEPYDTVLRAALIDTGYVDPAQRPSTRGRRHQGAWELGDELMVALSIAAGHADDELSGARGYDDEDDIDDVISAIDSLGYAVEELVEIADNVAELGVGGRTHLTIAKSKELERRKRRREAARAMGRRITSTRSRSDIQQPSDEQSPRQGDHDLAARDTGGISEGEAIRRQMDEEAERGDV